MANGKIYLVGLMLVVLALPGLGANIGTQIREGVYQEEVEGDLDAAIKIYEGIISKHTENQRYAAQATYRLGLCFLKKGQKDKAIKQFEQIVNNFPSQKTTLQKAKSQLKKLKSASKQLSERDRIIASSYIIHYKTVGTTEDGLKVFNRTHPKGVRTHHANRYRVNGETVSSICTDTAAGKDKIVSMIENNKQLALVKVKAPTMARPASSRLSERDRIIASSYVVHYKTVGTTEDGLKVLHRSHPEGVRTHHANRYRSNGETISSICTYTAEEKDKIVKAIEGNKQLALVKVEAPKMVRPANPMVIDSFPKTYSNDVSAGVDKLTVTFDQPMIKGNYSWVRWNYKFPKTTDKPYYDEKGTTCSLPVKLEPGTAYLIRINAKQYSSFMSLDKVRAQPFVLVFATKDKDGKPTPIPDNMLKFAKYINGSNTGSGIQNAKDWKLKQYQIFDNTLLDLDSGAAIVATKELPSNYDIGWDNDGGGVLMVNPKKSARIISLPGVQKDKLSDAIAAANKSLNLLRESPSRGVLGTQTVFCAVLTDKGKLAIIEIIKYSPAKGTINVWMKDSGLQSQGSKANVFEKIDGQVTRFIGEQFGKIAAEANKQHLQVNSHIHYVDQDGDLYSGGMNAFYNWTGKAIKGKTSFGVTSYPNQTHYGVDGQELNTEIVPDKRRPNHWQIYWIPDEPLAAGESLYYGWSKNYKAKLPKLNDDYFLQMQNKYGSSVIETFFLVLPKDMHISKSNKPTQSQELLNCNVYWWTKTVKQGENHVEKVYIAKGMGKYEFGEVIEKTVNDERPKTNFMLDLDSGKLYSVSDAEKWSKADGGKKSLEEYIMTSGVDLVGETGKKSLMGINIIAMPTHNERWNMSPGDVIEQVSLGKPGTPVPLSADGKLPKTFVFKTGQGSMGLLQIVEMQAGKTPHHFKVRYKLLEKSPTNKLTAEKLAAEGWKLWRQRKLAEAEGKFKEATKLDRHNENSWQGLGWSQLNQGKRHNAKDSFKKCVEINAKNSAALNGLGWIAHGQGDFDEAIQWWEKAIKAHPGATASLSGLTQVYMQKEEYSKAIVYYTMWLKAEPNNKQAKDGLEKAKAQQQKVGASTTYKEFTDEHIEKVVQKAVATISTCADGDPKIAKAMKTLKPIKPKLVLEVLAKHMDSKAATKRRSAIYIAWKGDFEDISPAVKKLTELCSHESGLTRGMAALALGEKKVASSFDVLTNMTLNDDNGYARRCGAYALGRLGNVKALDTLKKATEDSDPMVKQNAEASITMLTELKKNMPEKAEASIDLSTPSATINSFVNAVNVGNLEAALTCVSKNGHDYKQFKEMLTTESKSNHPFLEMIKAMDATVPIKFTSKSIEGDRCKIKWQFTLGKVYYFGGEKMQKGKHQEFGSYLELVDKKWLIRDI